MDDGTSKRRRGGGRLTGEPPERETTAPEEPSGADLVERVVDSRVLHRGKFLEFRIDTVERADGSRAIRDVAGHPGAVAIVALDAEDRVALVRQWRLPANAALLEIPAGGLDVADDATKEDPDVAARRELEEETGLRARTWRKLGEFYTAPGFTDELMHLYLATDLEPVSADGRLGPDEDERLILEWRPWQDAVADVEQGRIHDAKSIVGLFWLERLRRGQHTSQDAATAERGTVAGSPQVEESVTVNYRITMGEAVRAGVGLVRRSVGMRVLGIVAIVISTVAALIGDLFSIVGVLVGLGLVTGWGSAPLFWWQFRKRPDLVGADTTVTFDAAGVELDDPFTSGRTTWANYRRVHDVAGCFLFDNAVGTFLVVPKRAFSPAQLGVLYRLLDRNGLLPTGAQP